MSKTDFARGGDVVARAAWASDKPVRPTPPTCSTRRRLGRFDGANITSALLGILRGGQGNRLLQSVVWCAFVLRIPQQFAVRADHVGHRNEFRTQVLQCFKGSPADEPIHVFGLNIISDSLQTRLVLRRQTNEHNTPLGVLLVQFPQQRSHAATWPAPGGPDM